MAPYRLSDDERNEAISALAQAYVEGRLDEAEFDSRMGAATSATFATDLDPLFADLPARRGRRTTAVVPQRQRPPRPRAWPVALLIVVIVAMLTGFWLIIPLTFLLSRLAFGGVGCASRGHTQLPSSHGHRGW